ncbi:hypothetical protein [Methanopyrus sp.]
MGELADSVREHLVPAALNTIGLIVTIVVIQLIVPALASLGTIVPGIGVPVNIVITAVGVVLALYFAYGVLKHVKPIITPAADLISMALLGHREENLRTATYNLVMAAVVLLVAILLSPLMVSIPGAGAILSLLVLLGGVGLGGLLLVKAATGFYDVLKDKLEELAENLAERVEELERKASEKSEKTEESE